MIEPIKTKDLLKIFKNNEEEKKVSEEIVIEALKEGLVKAYIKQLDAPDAIVRVEFDENYIRLFHDLAVVEEDTVYEELEVSLDKAKEINPNLKVGDFLSREIDIRTLNRSSVLHVKSILKQKVREHEKQAIYNEYIDLKGELVFGVIESVEEKFVIINIGKTLALMPKSQQIIGERYREGDRIRVLITDVKKETKGAQVVVSRADSMLVKRLFEKEVPEIFQGTVEIKAIARDAGERTKMAVYSKDENVDPIGACIGPRGSRVQVIIEELKGEKIDVFQWSEDVGKLVKNAFSPANILACYYAEDKRNLVVVVDDNQLSLAIGKKGKNAKLAVKLTGRKIEIKTKSDVLAEGVDYIEKSLEFEKIQEEIIKEKEAKKLKALQEEMQKKREALESVEEDYIEQDEIELDNIENYEEEKEENFEVVKQVEIKQEPKKDIEEIKEELPKVEEKVKEELRPRTEFVSKFEEIADGSHRKQEQAKKKKRKKEDEERKLRASELRSKGYDFKVEYSEDELYEIEAMQEEEESNSWIEDDEIDFDEYDAYYDGDLK